MKAPAGSARKRWRERARRIESAARSLVATSVTVDEVGGESSVGTQALRRLERLLKLADEDRRKPDAPEAA